MPSKKVAQCLSFLLLLLLLLSVMRLVLLFLRVFLKGKGADQIALVAGNFSVTIPTLGYVMLLLK